MSYIFVKPATIEIAGEHYNSIQSQEEICWSFENFSLNAKQRNSGQVKIQLEDKQ